MLQEKSVVHPVIQTFETDRRPIFVLYGDDSNFEEIRRDLRDYLQTCEKMLYLSLDIEQYEVPEKTCFEVVQQLINSLLDTIPEADEDSRLSSIFRMLWNLRKKIRECDTDVQLAEFIRFTQCSCYPTLRHTLYKNDQPVVIGLDQFENVAVWAHKMYNFILEDLLDALEGVPLRFVLFVRGTQKPSLFYGSNEESAQKRVLFYKIIELSDYK